MFWGLCGRKYSLSISLLYDNIGGRNGNRHGSFPALIAALGVRHPGAAFYLSSHLFKKFA